MAKKTKQQEQSERALVALESLAGSAERMAKVADEYERQLKEMAAKGEALLRKLAERRPELAGLADVFSNSKPAESAGEAGGGT